MSYLFNLQLFADGAESGAGETAPAAAEQTGETVPVAGEQPAAEPAAKPSFEDLIKGEYKKDFDDRVQKVLKGRMKSADATMERLSKMEPMLQMLSKRYGVDPTDAEALNKAIEDDDSYYQDEATEKGMSVPELKAMRKMERENANLKRTLQEREAREQKEQAFREIVNQAEKAKEFYPGLDLNEEMQNENFARLVANGINVQDAYEVVHRKELTAAAMQFSAQKAQEAVANAVKSNSQRPDENGASSGVATTVKTDPSKYTEKDFEEILNRAKRGERIIF